MANDNQHQQESNSQGQQQQQQPKSEGSIKNKDDDDKLECSICFDAVTSDVLAELRPCGHQFCIRCITNWIYKKRQCPYCRQVPHYMDTYWMDGYGFQMRQDFARQLVSLVTWPSMSTFHVQNFTMHPIEYEIVYSKDLIYTVTIMPWTTLELYSVWFYDRIRTVDGGVHPVGPALDHLYNLAAQF